MADTLPLPSPSAFHRSAGKDVFHRSYTADQMRAYAAAAVEAEREACAVTAERAPLADDFDPGACAAEIAQLIRSRKDTQ